MSLVGRFELSSQHYQAGDYGNAGPDQPPEATEHAIFVLNVRQPSNKRCSGARCAGCNDKTGITRAEFPHPSPYVSRGRAIQPPSTGTNLQSGSKDGSSVKVVGPGGISLLSWTTVWL